MIEKITHRSPISKTEQLVKFKKGNVEIIIIFAVTLGILIWLILKLSNFLVLKNIKNIIGNILQNRTLSINKDRCLENTSSFKDLEHYPDKTFSKDLIEVFSSVTEEKTLYKINLKTGCVQKLASYEDRIDYIYKAKDGSGLVGVKTHSTSTDTDTQNSNIKGFNFFEGNRYWIIDLKDSSNKEVDRNKFESIFYFNYKKDSKETTLEVSENGTYNILISNGENKDDTVINITKSEIEKLCKYQLNSCLRVLGNSWHGAAVISPNSKYIIFTPSGWGEKFILIYDTNNTILLKIEDFDGTLPIFFFFHWIDDSKFLYGGLEKQIAIYEINKGNVTKKYINHETKNSQSFDDVPYRNFSNDGNYFLLDDNTENISQLLNLKTLEVTTLMGPISNSKVKELFSPTIRYYDWIDNGNLALEYIKYGPWTPNIDNNEYYFYLYNTSDKNLRMVVKSIPINPIEGQPRTLPVFVDTKTN